MSIHKVKGQKFNGESFEGVEDYLTVELPLQINLNGQAFTVTMRTPGHDTELSRGLLHTENVISVNTIPVLIPETNEKGEVISVNCLAEGITADPASRSLVSSSSCGLCGKTELVDSGLESIRLTPRITLDVALIPSMFNQMQACQDGFKKSGGCHASASFDKEGNIINCFEDIGRHNAVDKVIGDLILKNKLAYAEIVLVSGRVSYEIVSKAAKASIPYLIAVSAPSSLGVEIAEKIGMTLIAFCRDGRATVYTNSQQVKDRQYA